LDAVEAVALLLAAHPPLLDAPLEVPVDRPHRAVEQRLLDVHQDDAPPVLRRGVGDAAAHRPRADDSDDLDLHEARSQPSGWWQTASMLFPSGSSAKAP